MILHSFWAPRVRGNRWETKGHCLRCRKGYKELSKIAEEVDPQGYRDMLLEKGKFPWRGLEIWVKYISGIVRCVSNDEITIREIIE